MDKLDFSWTDEQTAIKDSMENFAKRELSPGTLERDEKGEFNFDGFKKAGKIGLLALPIPREYGGTGADILSIIAAFEGLGRGCSDNGFIVSIASHMINVEISIWLNGSTYQKEKYLPKLCSGELIGALGLTEPNAGSDTSNLSTTALKKDGYYFINGTKMFITNGPIADVLIVFATMEKSRGRKGIRPFIVEKGFPGFSAGKKLDKMGIRSSLTSELIFEDCKVPFENVMGEEGKGLKVLYDTLEWERTFSLSYRIGRMEALLETCIRYAKEREHFGHPIANDQAIQFKLSNMKVRLETARNMVYKVGWMKQQGIPATMEAAIAKLYLTESYVQSAQDAIQIHGKDGYMKEFGVEQQVRDAIIGTIGAGTSEIQRLIIAGRLLGKDYVKFG